MWGSRNFRLFFVGQLVSNSGTWLQNVAQGVLVLQLSGSPLMVGLTGAASFLPVAFLALAGGRMADRFDRRWLLIGTQVLAMAATGALAILAATDSVTVGAVIGVALAIGVQYALSIPAMMALLPALVEPGLLGQAIGMNSVTYNVARVLGPGLATAAIATLGFGWSFGLNSLSFLALIAALLLVRLPKEPPREGATGSVREVLTYAWGNRRIRFMLLAVAAVSVAADPVTTLAPVFASEEFGRRGADAGLVVAAFAIGSIVAAVLIGVSRHATRLRHRTLPLSMLAFAAGIAGFALLPWFWAALAVLLVGGVGFTFSSTTWTTGLQEEVPDELRGRIMGLWTLAFLGVRPAASLLSGGLADVAGPGTAALVAICPLLLVTLLSVRRLRAEPASGAEDRPRVRRSTSAGGPGRGPGGHVRRRGLRQR